MGPVQWLKPYTDEVLVELGHQGIKSLLAVPVRYALGLLRFSHSLANHTHTYYALYKDSRTSQRLLYLASETLILSAIIMFILVERL